MSDVGVANRSRLLRQKRDEISGIVTSRKRKLRELYTITTCEDGPNEINPITNLPPQPTNPDEIRFLELSDILQNRLLNEASIPTRRQLRSDTSKQRSPIRKVTPENRPIDASRLVAKAQRDASSSRKSRANTPGSRSDAAVESGIDGSAPGQSMQRSTSKGSQTDLPVGETIEVIKETFDHATKSQSQLPDGSVPAGESAIEERRTLESPSASPGADPRKIMPISAEDAAALPDPLVPGLGSHDGHHKAVTAHLPPREVQERHLQEARRVREQKEQLSIHLPPRDAGRLVEALSSPGSTIDAHSATTPALHDASTDTSPDNDNSRYEQERPDRDDEVETPIEFRKTAEEIAESEQHDRILQAQIDISSAEILKSPPRADDSEDQALEEIPMDRVQNVETQGEESLTREANSVARDIVEDDHNVAATRDEDVVMSDAAESSAQPSAPREKHREIADSDGDQTPGIDAMNVDATVKDSFDSNSTIEARTSETPAPLASGRPSEPVTETSKSSDAPESTPVRIPSVPTLPPRMTTRVQSGAIRQKSVSQILSEIDTPHGLDRTAKGPVEPESASDSPSRTTIPQSPGRIRSQLEKAKERERSKLSTVVFAAKEKTRPSSSNNKLVSNAGQAALDANGDYLMPLFLATATAAQRGVPTLDNLLQTAHKTITTSNAYVPITENQTVNVLQKIYRLQRAGKWSLRQPQRQREPTRQTTHWDLLLQEAKWMRTDFREERKWKMTCARNLAYACAEWVESDPEDRTLLQVKAIPPKSSAEISEDVEMVDDSMRETAFGTPDLVASGEFESLDDFDEEPQLNLIETVAPTAIFTLHDEDVVFGLRRSPTSDKLLEELPMYGSPLSVPTADTLDPDRFWKRRALPLSKYVEGRMELKTQAPPRKKSRFTYDEDDEDDEQVFGEPGSKRTTLPPEQVDVALFNPDHKHTRDRIHAGHQFRPPSEYQMPLQSFFECRTASQWTWAEDDELKAHVRDYSYNWSLISNMLTSRSLFSSGAERRTPWECFERWISLEGLPADMQKTHYFRAYNSRMEAANRVVTAQAAQAPQQVNGQGVVQPQRRRNTISFRVERRRQQKHLTMVDAMRKLAKKRETNIQKQQNAASLAAMRKSQEVPPAPRVVPTTTPQEFSRLKHEREERLKEQMQVYQQRQQQQQRAAMQARIAGQNNPQALPNGATPQRPSVNGALPNGTPVQTNQNLAVPGQNRPRGPNPPQMPGQVHLPNLRPPQSANGAPQAQMQTMSSGQLPMPNPAVDLSLIHQSQAISNQQRAIRMQQAQMQGQNPQIHNSPPRIGGIVPVPNFNQMPNANALFGQNTPGLSSPGPPAQGQAAAPRPNQHQQNRMEELLRQKYPNYSPEQIRRVHAETMNNAAANSVAAQRQSAMNAAAGGNMNGVVNAQVMNGQGASPQMYAQMLRLQQENQQKAAQAGGTTVQGHQRSGSGSATSGK